MGLFCIIKQRKNDSNLLIIITHDENFLRKLGQSDVMEYYWRVSKDSRQKYAVPVAVSALPGSNVHIMHLLFYV